MTQQEAYVEGFCKAAESYGISPKALYKFAYGVPRAVVDQGKGLVGFFPDMLGWKHTPEDVSAGGFWTGEDIAAMNAANKAYGKDPRMQLALDSGLVNRNWWNAHTNAQDIVSRPYRKLQEQLNREYPKSVAVKEIEPKRGWEWLSAMDKTMGPLPPGQEENLARQYHNLVANGPLGTNRTMRAASPKR